jgi:hypothetical protein
MLPVSTGEKVDQILNPNATLAGVLGLVNQVRTQARLEQEGMQDSLDKLKSEIKSSVLGRASAPPPGAPKAAPKTADEYLRSLQAPPSQ